MRRWRSFAFSLSSLRTNVESAARVASSVANDPAAEIAMVPQGREAKPEAAPAAGVRSVMVDRFRAA